VDLLQTTMKLNYLIISTAVLSRKICRVFAQQSAAGQDTIIGIVGRDFVMMGADTSSSGGGGIALTSSNIDKLAVIHDGGGGDILNSLYGSDDDDIISRMQRRSVEQQAIVVGFAGDAADADRLAGTLKIHTQVREYEAGIGNDVICTFDGDLYDDDQMSSSSLSKSRTVLGTISPSGLDAESIAYFARKEIATRMRSRQPLQLCLLVGGMVRCASSANYSKIPSFHERVQKQVSAASSAYLYSSSVQSNTNSERQGNEYCNMEDSEKSTNTETSPILLSPKLFWLDQYGSLQNLSYACHGFGSNFALSVLDQGFRMGMSRQEAECLIRECFEQLRQRYLINSPQPPRIKCIDAFGVREMK
jgi:20S proteasome subunit beta 4